MVKTRIVVLQMKQIIRTAIFAVIGLILIISLIIIILPNNNDDNVQTQLVGAFIPGVYSSYIILHNQPVRVAVTVDSDRVIDIALTDMNEVQEVFYPLFRPTLAELSEQIIRYQTTQIDMPLEIQHTSRILLSAVENALAQAVAGY